MVVPPQPGSGFPTYVIWMKIIDQDIKQVFKYWIQEGLGTYGFIVIDEDIIDPRERLPG